MTSDKQSNSKSNTPAGNTPSPLDGTARPAPSTRINYSAILQNQAALVSHQQPHLLPYNSLTATAASAQQQQLYAQAARSQQSAAAASPAGRLLAAGKPPPEANNIGGVPIPPMAAGTPTNLRIEAAAQYAAGAAVPYNGNTGVKRAAAAVAAAAAISNGNNSDHAIKKRKVAEKAAASTSHPPQSHPMLQAPAPQTSMGEHPPVSAASTTATANTALMQKQQSNRDRNREHARSTRLRKKAYVNKLKELLDALHVERSDDDRKRRVAVQKLAEIQDLRRKVVNTFFGYHARCERNVTKWRMILEDDFWLKQPVTPYRSFRRCEIEKVRVPIFCFRGLVLMHYLFTHHSFLSTCMHPQGSRITKGVEGMAEDAASMSVMIETIGSRNLRWLRRKRDYFLSKSNATTKLDRVGQIRTNAANAAAADNGSGVGGSRTSMPHSIVRQNSRLQHAISSLSSSSESGHGSSGEDLRKVELSRRSKQQTSSKHRSDLAAKKVSCSGSSNQLSSSSNDTRQQTQQQQTQQQEQHQQQGQSNDYHDYHAPSLLDPLPESSDSVASDNCVVGKHMLTGDSSSEDDDSNSKKQKVTETSGTSTGDNVAPKLAAAAGTSRSVASMPSNIARSGISHSVKVLLPPAASLPNGHAQLARAPAVSLPPFAGIGKKSSATTSVGVRSGSSSSSSVEPTNNESVASTAPTAAAVANHNANNNNLLGSQPSVIVPKQSRKRRNEGPSANYLHPQSNFIDNDTTSSSSMESSREIQAYYHLNEDDMILTDDVLMCPFIFRSQDAVLCGALSECVMPGMLRACFGPTNKLSNVEMIFDAMGFCQQLERASGNDSLAQIIPNCLQMALGISDEARVITQSKAPFPIVSVNEAWTRVTGYTQVDVEGKDLSILNGRETKEKNSDIESVAKGQCSCSVNVHYDVNGRDFFSFVCSYPLTNLKNEVTHLLHVFQELPARE
eukprot:scaffold37850_cov226-Skeletonema_marinoi.AAC.3